ELDAENNGNYVTMGVSQLLSVPFANYAFSGNAGASAYEVWLGLGNIGTEDNFINSLTGPDGEQGEPGISAYEEWLALGNTGTETDFLNSLTGTDGEPGVDGLSAYDVWLSLGNTGTEEEFINSLTGPEGAQGEPGISAYDVWLSLGNEGTEEEFINSLTGPSGTSSWTDGEEAVSTTKNVGIGTANPTSSLQIIAPEGVKAGDPIFEVKNAFGKTVFAVYENEVKVFVEDTTTASGGFTVNSRNEIDETQELMAVGPQQTVVYVDENAKESVGGFAISGRTATKGVADLLRVTSGLTEFFVDEPGTKESVGGFAISGRTASKGLVDVVNITPYSTNFYVDTTVAKESVGGFAISGRTATKGVGDEMFKVVPGFTEIFVPASGAKESVGGFAISGRTATKGVTEDLLKMTSDLTEFFVKQPAVKESVGGFAISGRTATKGLVDVLNITPDYTQFFVDEPAVKESVGGFAISGRTATKVTSGQEIFKVTPGLTEVFVDEPTTKESVGGFAISGRTAGKISETYNVMHVQPQSTDIYIKPNQNKMLPDGFRIFGMNPLDMAAEPVEFFNVSEQGVVVNTNMIVAPKVVTYDPINVTQTSAEFSGAVTDTMNTSIMDFGFVYSTASAPTIELNPTNPAVAGVVSGAGTFDSFTAFLYELAPGTTYYVRAFATNVDMVTGYGVARTFTTEPPVSVSFSITDAVTLESITDAQLTYTPFSGTYTGIENEPGNYTFEVVLGEYDVVARAFGYMETYYSGIVEAGGQTVDLSMTPANVTFRVTDPEGNPVPDALVHLEDLGGQLFYEQPTSSLGNAAFGDEVTPGDYNYTVDAFGYDVASDGPFTVTSGHDIVNVTLTPGPSYTVTFKVERANSTDPAVGATVNVSEGYKGGDSKYFQLEGTTDSQGNVTFDNLPEGGNYSVSAEYTEENPYIYEWGGTSITNLTGDILEETIKLVTSGGKKEKQ
ncbi:MAG: carboxypeptidase-like regulatory domain-containing protein, partial [Salinivirgaceae bacterium]|nr:carboxypeptidase-like regulatory domain-containing protein [Salinivirgaceae bacterium]